jgi:hypothetical protein
VPGPLSEMFQRFAAIAFAGRFATLADVGSTNADFRPSPRRLERVPREELPAAPPLVPDPLGAYLSG